MKLADIHFHDSRLLRVIEIADAHDLLFEVQYPVEWENNVFELRTIAFRDCLNYRVDEGPFVGAPTMLDVYDLGQEGDRYRIQIQTNAGTRTLEYQTVELLSAQEGSVR